MKRKGFVLIELLIAAMLLSLVSTGLLAGFIQGLKAQKRIQEGYRDSDPLHLFFLQADKDLRNGVPLNEYPFTAKNGDISFPALETQAKEKKLLLIRYFVEGDMLKRSEEELTAKLTKEKPKEKVLLKNLKSFNFKFPYLDPKENVSYEPFWLTEPYFGIPRAVKMEVLLHGSGASPLSYTKLVSIPQGAFGHIKEGEAKLA